MKKSLLFYFIVTLNLSCINSSTEKKSSEAAISANQAELSVICQVIDLNGIHEIYHINKDTLYYQNVTKPISENISKELSLILNTKKDTTIIGCGTCKDTYDYKFTFTRGDEKRIWIIDHTVENKDIYPVVLDTLIAYYIELVDGYSVPFEKK